MDLNIRVIPNNPSMQGIAEMYPDVEFACPDGHSLKMQILAPCKPIKGEAPKHPLIIFLQGSAWTKPNQYFEIPQLSEYARKGYVVATVTHRSAFEAPAPAFLEDTKSAIRYLRAHAEEYRIDPERVAIWGTSSGGNTALMIGLTGDDPAFKNDVCPEQSDSVKAVVECFGPTDLVRMVTVQYKPKEGEERPKKDGPNLFTALGGSEDPEIMLKNLEKISPVYYVKPGMKLPPFMIIHGNADPVVLYEDSKTFYTKMLENGYKAEMICIEGAEHEGSFWSDAVHEAVQEYLTREL